MKDVLDEGLIITLITLQPQKERVRADYFASSPSMACGSCYGTTCQGSCKTNGCKGSIKQKKK